MNFEGQRNLLSYIDPLIVRCDGCQLTETFGLAGDVKVDREWLWN